MKLRPINYILFASAIFIFTILAIFQWKNSTTQYSTAKQFQDIQALFLEKESLINKYIASPMNFNTLLEWAVNDSQKLNAEKKHFQSLIELPFTLAILKGGDLAAWSQPDLYYSVDWANNNWYLSGDSVFSRIYPIQYQKSDLRVLCQFNLPGKFTSISSSDKSNANGQILKDNQGKGIAIVLDVSQSNTRNTRWQLILYCLAYSLLLISISLTLTQNKKLTKIWPFLILLFIPILFRAVDYWSGIGAGIDRQLISSSTDTTQFLSGTFGNLVILIALYFTFLTHILQYPRWFVFAKKTRYRNIKLGTIFYFLNFLSIFLLLNFCRELVTNSGVDFEFSTFLTLGVVPLLGILIFAILIIRFFFFSYLINSLLVRYKLNFKEKAIAMLVTSLLLAALLLVSKLNMPVYIVILVCLLFALIFDIFIEIKSPTLGWLVIWVIFFSAFATITLFKFNRDRENDEKRKLVSQLARSADNVAIQHLNELVLFLKTNRQFYPQLDQAIHDMDIRRIEEIFRIGLTKDEYLSNYYDFSICIIKNADTRIGSENVYDLLQSNQLKFTDKKHYLFAKVNDVLHGGLLKFYWTSGEHDPVPLFYILMQKKNMIPANLVTERRVPFLGLTPLFKYDYAIYKSGRLIESQGRMYPDIIDVKAIMQGSNERIISTSIRSELIRQLNPETSIIIGKDLQGMIKPVSLFSFLFMVIILLAVILSVINSVYRILPLQLPIYFSRRLNLRQRIEFSIIFVIVLSFVAIAWVTSLYFKDLSIKMEQQQVNDKSFALVTEIEHKLNSTQLDSLRVSALMDISNSHQLDFTIYNLTGTKVFSTQSNVFKPQLVEKMPPIAYAELALDGSPYYFNIHSANNLINKAFLPLRNDQLQKIAWLQVPVKSSMGRNIFAPADFLGTLLNVYVFLLLMSGAIAIGIANSITKPIVRLVENLRKIKLGKKNEILVWNKSDEIGTLIKEYNNMITQLESSADHLAKSEREGAWREMARQVAHEIKNPLTPMKLSAQYLMRKVEGKVDPEVEESIRSTTNTLIEQIDNLAEIAGEFGNFARMPAPVMEFINLNSLISNIHDLFHKHDEATFHYFEPIDDIYVMADRAHLMRVMNNLLKNALQSIPHGRKGKIDIYLEANNQFAVIRVRDNGIGIREDLRENVFSPNFTTKTSGMGLGLALSKSIIESFNGKIYFRTVTGEGTEFIIELPL
jgi:signal transduction histidine kinase